MKTKFKLLSLVLALCCAVAIIPTVAMATEVEGVWTDYAASAFAGGSGTEEDPYQIATAEQLALLASDINSGVKNLDHSGEYFVITSDIDLSAHRWIPIGDGTTDGSHHGFYGRFEGSGKTITGLYVDESDNQFAAGLFGNFSGEYIKNLNIKDAYVTTETERGEIDGAGILVGNAAPLYGASILIENCSVTGKVESASAYTGGLVGSNSYGTYNNCTADVTVDGAGYAGGFVGHDFLGNFNGCVSRGKVSGFNSVGGFAGALDYGSKIEKCASYASVEGSNWHVGGFVGYAGYKSGSDDTTISKISNCVAFGDVENALVYSDMRTGGFVGTNDGCVITACHAAGKVSTPAGSGEAGGFMGIDIDGTTAGCSFDHEKNEALKGIASYITEGTNDVDAETSAGVAANICVDYYGGHNYGAYRLDDENALMHARTCLRCSYVEKEEHNRLPSCGDQVCSICNLTWNAPHVWEPDNATANNDATCYKNGTKTVPCKYCDETDTVENSDDPKKDAHLFENYVYNNDATCNANGTETAKCKWYDGVNCTAEDTREVADSKLPHSFSNNWSADANGHWHECTNDDCTANDGVVPHSASDDGDCTTAVVCDVCGYVLVSASEGHTLKYTSNGDGTHTVTCTTEGCTYSMQENCSGGDATCTAKAKCDSCLGEYGEINKDNHVNSGHVDAQPATKTAEGNIEYWYCSDCGKYFANDDLTEEISKEDTIIERLPSGDDGKGSDGGKGDTKPAGGDTKDTKSNEESKSDNPKTGERYNPVIWIVIIAICAGAGADIVLRRKKVSEK